MKNYWIVGLKVEISNKFINYNSKNQIEIKSITTLDFILNYLHWHKIALK